ncbi:MAG: hypothetical protein Q8M22_10670 [Actinomycetota bacterium]|nr:hypothetical protein [Actinomycetota bacterium]
MRDEFGEIDPDEIDILDADPNAFAALPQPPDDHGTTPGTTPEPVARRRPRWLVPALVASAVALVAGGVLVWQPWAGDTDTGGVSFPSGTTGDGEPLTEQLVFGDPPGELADASIGGNDDGFTGFGVDAVGYFFAEPSAKFQFGEGGAGRWAAFFAVPEDSDDAPDVDVDMEGATAGTVQGSPASITVEAQLLSVSFGPVDGWMFSVATSDLSRAETLAFAEAVSVDGETAVIADSTVLGEMLPLGDVDDYFGALQLVLQLSAFGQLGGDAVSLRYDDDELNFTVGSVPAGEHSLEMLQFVFGEGAGAASTIRVHGLPAIAATTDEQFMGDGSVTFVAWVEGGRLVMVSGPDDPDALVALAETVRPATDEEWAEVVVLAAQPDEFDDDFFGEGGVDEPDRTLLAAGAMPGGGTFEFSVGYSGDTLMTCLDQETDNGGSGACSETVQELPMLSVERIDGLEFLVAMTTDEVGEVEVLLTLDDGSVETYTVEWQSPDLPGPAGGWLLPDGWQQAELVIDGELVIVTEP